MVLDIWHGATVWRFPVWSMCSAESPIFYENLIGNRRNPHVHRKRYIKKCIKQSLLIANELEIPLLNMHMSRGVYFTLPDQKVFLFDKYRDIYLKNIQYFKVMCETMIGGEGINISIENTDGFTAFQKEALDILLDSSIFTFTWDIGHSHSASKIDEKYILQNECKLKHFHIHDAIGKQNHLTLGEGDINLLEKLNIARRNYCRCVIETKTVASLHESLNWLVTHWIYK